MTEFRRPTARVLLFDAQDRLLLFLTRWHRLVDRQPRWLTPGGGIEPGESAEQAARRELQEETGLVAGSLGEPVGHTEISVPRVNGDIGIVPATYFVYRTDSFEPSNAGWTVEEHDDVLAFRWWTLDGLESTPEPVQPDGFVGLARSALGRLPTPRPPSR
ncbi:NUDIX hydrolase [Lysobacter korlensis]|uniref:NUDIX hydrolase n=1 Tax=Lysobacter korlensis TaxID=553636 RepID=A0ABV6RWV7_9GAMM